MKVTGGARTGPGTSRLADLDDGLLARRIAAGHADGAAAEEVLCRRYAGRLAAFARRRMGSAGSRDADDLAQESLLTGLRRLRAGEVREPDRIGAFLLGVARHLVDARWRRGERRTEPLDGEWAATVPLAELRVSDPLARARIPGCLEALPERQRTAVVLSFYAEQTSTEIAASLGLTAGNVRVLVHRGVAGLRACVTRAEAANPTGGLP